MPRNTKQQKKKKKKKKEKKKKRKKNPNRILSQRLPAQIPYLTTDNVRIAQLISTAEERTQRGRNNVGQGSSLVTETVVYISPPQHQHQIPRRAA